MTGRADWRAANDHPGRPPGFPTRAWVRPRGETWYRPVKTASGEARPSRAGLPQHLFVTTSRVAGSPVYTTGGQRLGRVAEIALDEDTGEVAHVVLASGGFLGFGRRLARVPWKALSYEPRRGGYVLDLPTAKVNELNPTAAKVAFGMSADRGGWAEGA
jgi:hypothetical protein